MYYCYVRIISPWKRVWSFIWKKNHNQNPKMLCAKCGWNSLSGSWEKDFWISSMYFCYFIIISAWKMAWPFIWIYLNSHHPRMLCAKLVLCCFWRRYFNFVNVILLFRYYLPLEKAMTLQLKNLNPLHPRMLCAMFGWIWLRRLGEEDEMWKVYIQTDGQTNWR